MLRLLRVALFVALIIALPFILLVRISVYYHTEYHYHPYICTLIGMVVTSALLLIYYSLAHRKLGGNLDNLPSLKFRSAMAFSLVFVYSVNGLLYLSNSNGMYSDVKKEYRQLHPILRLGVSTLAHLDKDLIITDAARKPEDYGKMGLRINKNSLHYPQKDGFVYALDIRTKSRSGLKNFLVRSYFRMMGFKTDRHGGTGDHLHISLYNHHRPKAI